MVNYINNETDTSNTVPFRDEVFDPTQIFQIIYDNEEAKRINPMRRGTPYSAGYDLAVYIEELGGNVQSVTLNPGEQKLFKTGMKLWIRNPFIVGMIYPRSSAGIKRGLTLANTVAVIDSDYQGEWMLCIKNTSTEPQTIIHGERVAQVVFTSVAHPVAFNEQTKFSDTSARGSGGIGSTGKGPNVA